MKTIRFAHLDAAMRIVREPERPAAVDAEQDEAVEADAAAAPAKVAAVARPAAARDRLTRPTR